MKKKGLISTRFHLPYNPDLIERARDLRKNMTPAEMRLWYGFLKNFKYRVFRQRPIDNYIVDFYCSKLRLVIEVDGRRPGGDKSPLCRGDYRGVKIDRFNRPARCNQIKCRKR